MSVCLRTGTRFRRLEGEFLTEGLATMICRWSVFVVLSALMQPPAAPCDWYWTKLALPIRLRFYALYKCTLD